MTRPRSVSLLAAFVLLTGCSRSDSGSTNPGPFTDPGETIRVQQGAEFQIRLESNATTGYQWVLADSLRGPVRLVGSEYVAPAQQNPPAAGAGGHERWTFRAASPGEAVISLVYARPWEKPISGDTARFRVVVR